MSLQTISFDQKLAGFRKYVRNRSGKYPRLVSIEMTKFCNAGCDFCDDWKTKHSPKLGDVVDMVRTLRPMVLALTGGEPLIERRVAEIIRDVKKDQDFIYIYLITNGSLLSEEKAIELFDAGLNQINISINYLDSRQSKERNILGLSEKIADIIPKLTARGYKVAANTVIMRENLDQILPIARQTYKWGAMVSYSTYTDFKNGNGSHYFDDDQLEDLKQVIAELTQHKKKYHNLGNSQYYLDRIMTYFTDPKGLPNCKAGNGFVQLTPDGKVRQCADFAPFTDYKDYKGMDPTDCTRCWYGCRGESEASFTIGRVAELLHRM